MKKIISLVLATILSFSMVACGEIAPVQDYEKVSVQTALHTSPELNVQDNFYTKVLKDSMNVLYYWTRMGGDINRFWKVYWEPSDAEGRIERIEGSTMNIEDVYAVYNVEDYTKLIEKPETSEAIANRLDWAKQNQFYFGEGIDAYSYENIDHTHSFLDVKFNFEDIEEDRTKDDRIAYNPYYNTYSFSGVKGEKAKLEDGVNETLLTGPYDHIQAEKNLKIELSKMKETVQNYLEQKYLGKDNGVEFSDYMLKYCDYDSVEAFVKVQDMNITEIKDVNIYANPITFHPYVDVEYTVVADKEYKLHEMYFLEIDKEGEEFVYKIAYVADYSYDSTAKYSYRYFRDAPNLGVNESFEEITIRDFDNSFSWGWNYYVPEDHYYYKIIEKEIYNN